MGLYEGYSCPVCNKIFAEKDDVVVCFECGAPHHRQCYNEEGKCFFEEKHGTDQSWDRQKSGPGSLKRCTQCGTAMPEGSIFCVHCGCCPKEEETGNNSPFFENRNGFLGGFGFGRIDSYTGINLNEEIEGVTMGEIAAYVGVNSQYYLPIFQKMSKGGSKVRFNGAALLLNPFWLFFRKMYLLGVIMAALAIGASAVITYLFPDISSMYEILNNFDNIDSNIGLKIMIMYAVLFVLLIATVVMAMFANTLYMNHVIRSIKKLRQKYGDTPEYYSHLNQAGGISLTSAAIYLAVSNLISILVRNLFI